MIYQEQLLKIYENLLTQKEQMQEELQRLPDGYLNMRMQKERTFYSWIIPVGGRRKKVFRKGITKDREQVLKLVRKKYLHEALKYVDLNIETIKKAADMYFPMDESALLQDFVKKHPNLKEGIYYGCVDDDEWSKDYKMPVDFYESGLKSISAGGTKMRSKGEVIIASRLDFYRIPYRYEAPIEHPDCRRVPDFTIMRPTDRKLIYWEHLGMVNNREYMEENLRKLREYEDVGVTPWNNLIMTYDRADGGIDVKLIDALIHGWLM